MRQKQNDVFVLGEESLLDEPAAIAASERVSATDEREPAVESRSSAPGPQSAQTLGPRRLAVLGIGAAAAATLGALELSGAGPAQPQRSQTSSAPAPLAHPAPAALPARSAEPRRRHGELRRRAPGVHRRKPAREPTADKASVGSAVELSATSVTTVAAPTPAPLPPSPPPPRGMGGRGGRENFGFER